MDRFGRSILRCFEAGLAVREDGRVPRVDHVL